MKRAFLLYMVLAAGPLTAAPPETAGAPLAGKLLITGSSTMAPVIEDLGKRFRTLHPGVVITVVAVGSERGVTDALEGKSDVGMASRELTLKEQALFAIPIARDGVAFAVHEDNPVRGLTRAQVIALFTGTIVNWKALGGRDARIEAVTRTPGHGELDILIPYFGIEPGKIRAANVIGDNQEVARFVAATPNAIAFLSTAVVDNAVQKGLPLKPLALDGKLSSRGSIRDGTWPMARPLYLLTRRVPTGLARAFIQFALSPAAVPVIVEHKFVTYLQ